MQPRAPRSLAALIGVLAATSALADDAGPCVAIADDRARLACYDAAFGRDAASQERPAPTPSKAAATRAAPAQDRPVAPSAQDRSLIGERWSRYGPALGHPFLVRLHNVNYLVLRHSDRANAAPSSPAHPEGAANRDIERDELKFQLSFKARLWESEDRRYAAWLGYTQQSNWQALNAPQSRPFRESDYQPELMFVVQPDIPLRGGLRWQLFNLGLVHQSNGNADPSSRSWNRLYAQFGVEAPGIADGRLALLVRPWVRLHEPASKDDNPDITDYLGYGDAVLAWQRQGQELTLTVRGNPRTGKGALQVEWSARAIGPLRALGPFRFYAQLFTGYGESLIDYNFRQTVVGAGFALSDLP
ncbi:MAG: phospholipase A [Rudaea sp.]